MKQQIKLNVTPRAQTGRSASRRLRKTNQVPAILYGKHTAPESLAIDGPEFIRLIKAISGSSSLIELQRQDKADKALTFLQEVQRDPITDRYLHVDLREVKADETFEIRVKIQLTGESFGVKNQSGVLESSNSGVRIRCLPKELKVGETIHVAELKQISGVQFMDDPGQSVVSCVEPVAEIAAAVAAAPSAGAGAAAPAAGDAAAGAAPAAGAAAQGGDAKAAAPAGGAKAGAPAAGAKPAAPAKK